MPSKYQIIETAAGDSPTSHLLKPDDSISDVEQLEAHHSRPSILSFLPWAIHTAVFLLYTVIFFHALPQCPKLLPTELAYAEPWIHYDKTIFQPSGLHASNIRVNDYEGPPSEAINSRWDALWDVGIYGISNEEADRLGIKGAIDPKHPDKQLVTIAVFHQLHCLNRIRQVAWGNSNPMNEDPQIAIKHTDHCIDYIRQALICHGDVTPIPLYWKEFDESGAPTRYETDWEVTHTCRNWEMLYKWALAGNQTGWHI